MKKYTIKNDLLELTVLNIGATIYELKYKGQNVVVNYTNIEDYNDNKMYLGCIIGRSAGRIEFPKGNGLNLDANFRDKYNLHGNYIHRALFDVELYDTKIILTYKDLAGAYPGDCDITVIYELSENKVTQTITSHSNIPSIHNFTNHTYFNLGYSSILEHSLKINADKVWLVDQNYLPEELIDVENTAFDFKRLTKIGDNLKKGHPQFEYTKFIDNPFKLTGDIELVGKDIKMNVKTNRDYVVCYTGNSVLRSDEQLNIERNLHPTICLETQKLPGDINFVKDDLNVTEYIFETL